MHWITGSHRENGNKEGSSSADLTLRSLAKERKREENNWWHDYIEKELGQYLMGDGGGSSNGSENCGTLYPLRA